MAKKNGFGNYETYDVNPYGDSNTRYESVPYGYTVSPTCPPEAGDDPYDQTMSPHNGSSFTGYTPTTPNEPAGYTGTEPIKAEDDVGETEIVDAVTNVRGEGKIRPVVGWMIGTRGVCKYRDFRLHGERNYIGRNPDLDIVIPDKAVSREPAVQVVFDPRNSTFHLASCDRAKINSYCNGELLLGPRQLKDGDRIQLGESELMFKSLCGEGFRWEDEDK